MDKMLCGFLGFFFLCVCCLLAAELTDPSASLAGLILATFALGRRKVGCLFWLNAFPKPLKKAPCQRLAWGFASPAWLQLEWMVWKGFFLPESRPAGAGAAPTRSGKIPAQSRIPPGWIFAVLLLHCPSCCSFPVIEHKENLLCGFSEGMGAAAALRGRNSFIAAMAPSARAAMEPLGRDGEPCHRLESHTD